jgi:hypothetical protein
MGLAVIAVVFVASLFGVPTLIDHSEAHPQAQQLASVQTPAQPENGDAPATDHP